MSAQTNDSDGKGGDSSGSGSKSAETNQVTGSPAELEKAIQARRDHLASTIDELTARAKPKELARRSAIGAQRKLQSLTHTPDGQLRTERLAAVAGAITVVTGLLVFLRRRR
jgi:hypothetical protein